MDDTVQDTIDFGPMNIPSTFNISNITLLSILLQSLGQEKNTPLGSATFESEYDYIVVGAGSAGSVVANRLSEIPCVSVLLLEAGMPPPLLNDVPGYGPYFWGSDLDWNYKTVPQKHTGKGTINNQIVWRGGKALGGSSCLNSMLYVRGVMTNYDLWETMGAKGWGAKDVYPYFLKLEDNKDSIYLDDDHHAIGGPLTVMMPRYDPEIKWPIFEAAKEMGYSIHCPNDGGQAGYYVHQATLRNGTRCSTAKAYLVPAENRKNLNIVPNAYVRKVVIENKKAIGVVFDHGGSKHSVKARREVIVSGGTVNTAQLLMLSGIGPREHLEKFNIPVHADLPVGDNFQDHGAPIPYFELDSSIPTSVEKSWNPANIERYIKNRTGPLTSTNFLSAMAFLNGTAVNGKDVFPNFELIFLETDAEGMRKYTGMTPEVYQQVLKPYENKAIYGCKVYALSPRSRGTVRLHSKEPHDPPLIDPNYFADQRDVDDVVQGMKACYKIASSKQLQKLGSKPLNTLYPGCEHYDNDLDRYFECQVRSVVATISHPIGTAKMGDPNDPTSVVDPELKVKGIERLRVVDASVMPIIPSGNTNVPIIMLAEKASDIIKGTITCRQDSVST